MHRISRLTNKRGFTVFQAFFVTILWSSSWPIIKFGLEEIPPLIFAGMRYFVASAILLIYVFSFSKYRHEIKNLSVRWWSKLVFYGVIFYSITQGAQFLGLQYLPAITVSLLLSFTPIIVLFFANTLLKEKSNAVQFLLVIVALGGALLYFLLSPELISTQFNIVSGYMQLFISSSGSIPLNLRILGLIIVIVGVLANAFSAIIGRSINQSKEVSSVVITSVSMFIGSVILLISGLIVEGIPKLSPVSVGYILWLSIVNTALAFTLWNHAMQKLRAVEISIINNTMLFQITILAVIFLAERPSGIQWIGLVIVAISGLILPLFKTKKDETIIVVQE
ncbi:MAG: EamA family transporter [Candidatus Heimdallarchaeota archaeon]|nr:EamA family transporter [Candidatus Heimdallarchaeota archaeon]